MFNVHLGFQWFAWIHGQWMIISYVWVLETSTGATWRVGYLRLVSPVLILNAVLIHVMIVRDYFRSYLCLYRTSCDP
jgi:hypothetical protein